MKNNCFFNMFIFCSPEASRPPGRALAVLYLFPFTFYRFLPFYFFLINNPENIQTFVEKCWKISENVRKCREWPWRSPGEADVAPTRRLCDPSATLRHVYDPNTRLDASMSLRWWLAGGWLTGGSCSIEKVNKHRWKSKSEVSTVF